MLGYFSWKQRLHQNSWINFRKKFWVYYQIPELHVHWKLLKFSNIRSKLSKWWTDFIGFIIFWSGTFVSSLAPWNFHSASESLPHLPNTWKREFWWCSSKRFCSLTLLHWIRHGDPTRWTGDETGLTSPLISTPLLPPQLMKGYTTPPGSMPSTLCEQVEQEFGFF